MGKKSRNRVKRHDPLHDFDCYVTEHRLYMTKLWAKDPNAWIEEIEYIAHCAMLFATRADCGEFGEVVKSDGKLFVDLCRDSWRALIVPYLERIHRNYDSSDESVHALLFAARPIDFDRYFQPMIDNCKTDREFQFLSLVEHEWYKLLVGCQPIEDKRRTEKAWRKFKRRNRKTEEKDGETNKKELEENTNQKEQDGSTNGNGAVDGEPLEVQRKSEKADENTSKADKDTAAGSSKGKSRKTKEKIQKAKISGKDFEMDPEWKLLCSHYNEVD